MAHPARPDLNIASTISSAIAMDQQQQQQQQHDPHPQASPLTPHNDGPHAGANGGGVRKRKKSVAESPDASGTSEPRRLRRSHEACARCRSKKIKASAVGSDRLAHGKFLTRL